MQFLHLCTSKTPTLSADLSVKCNSYHALEKCEGVKESGENHEKQSSISSPFVNPSTFQGKRGISEIYLSTKYFGINTNSEHFDKELEKVPESVAANHKELEKCEGVRKCYVSKKKGSIKYVDSSCIKNPYNFWKVFSPQACGKINDGFKTLIIGSPDEIASQTFFTFKVNSFEEACSLKSYLESDYANFMLKLRKIDHHINKNTMKWILLPPLNQIWTNDSINSLFGLTKREIKTLNSN